MQLYIYQLLFSAVKFNTFSHNSFICVKSLTVVPHKEAVFSTRTTFPLYLSMLTTCPSRVLALMSWKAMLLLPMSARAARRPLTVQWRRWQLLKPPPLLMEVSRTCRCLLSVAAHGKILPEAEQGSLGFGFGAEFFENYFILMMSRRCLRVGLSWMGGHRVRTMTFGFDTFSHPIPYCYISDTIGSILYIACNAWFYWL